MFTKTLKRGDKSPEVQLLQIKLAGFRGTVWDGSFGPGTELQVMQFQKDFMGSPAPTGIVDPITAKAIDTFAMKYPIDFSILKCPCGNCSGFGKGLGKGQYVAGMPQVEAYNMYEYPGIHKAILWAVRAVIFYNPQYTLVPTSGYRCGADNVIHNRTSTNHHGKAVDLGVVLPKNQASQPDAIRNTTKVNICNAIRGKMVEVGNFQIGWDANNRKSFEPSNIAPTWIHQDVRSYDKAMLDDKFFVKNSKDLDA